VPEAAINEHHKALFRENEVRFPDQIGGIHFPTPNASPDETGPKLAILLSDSAWNGPAPSPVSEYHGKRNPCQTSSPGSTVGTLSLASLYRFVANR
jgi:hypothetical protein